MKRTKKDIIEIIRSLADDYAVDKIAEILDEVYNSDSRGSEECVDGDEAYTLVRGPRLTKNSIEEIVKLAEKGNINARLELILHNQTVLKRQLNKLEDKIFNYD